MTDWADSRDARVLPFPAPATFGVLNPAAAGEARGEGNDPQPGARTLTDRERLADRLDVTLENASGAARRLAEEVVLNSPDPFAVALASQLITLLSVARDLRRRLDGAAR